MKLQYLGTAAAECVPAFFCECDVCKKSRAAGGRNIRSRSQAIIDDKILIDWPADTYMHFVNYDIPLHKIRTCLITHSHRDHLYKEDFASRAGVCSHLSEDFTLTFYSDKSAYDIINEYAKEADIPKETVDTKLVRPGEVFDVEGYAVTALRANHDPASDPLVFIIEKEGKSIFYSNDSGEYPEETVKYLEKLKKPLDIVSLDCTMGCIESDYYGHLTYGRCIKMRDKLVSCGAADEKTVFVLNHFSHNSEVTYDELVKIAAEENFLVSYDGMVLEI